jgi:transposase
MEVVHPRCAGLDVHKRTVVACRLTPGPGAEPAREVRTFGTTTRELLALADWLAEVDVSHVAIESNEVVLGNPSTTSWRPASSCSSSTPPI